jgi:hypothetical protein
MRITYRRTIGLSVAGVLRPFNSDAHALLKFRGLIDRLGSQTYKECGAAERARKRALLERQIFDDAAGPS